jgi:hypothetical protein
MQGGGRDCISVHCAWRGDIHISRPVAGPLYAPPPEAANNFIFIPSTKLKLLPTGAYTAFQGYYMLLARGICCLTGGICCLPGASAACQGHHLLTRGICCLLGASSAYQGHLLLTKGIICLPGAYAACLPGMYAACQGRLLLRRVGGANAAF